MTDKIIVSYAGEWYDVTKFCHPGDSKGVRLADYNGKSVDDMVNAHYTNDPSNMLKEAKEKGNYEGIIFYLGKR